MTRPGTAALLALALLPGVGPSDPRVGADPSALPWAALGRLQIPGVGRCTAVMVAPHWAVTAAHCLGVRVLGHMAPAGAIHVLLGYRDGRFRQHLVADRVEVAPEAERDAALPEMGGHRGRDVALLHFAVGSPDSLTVMEPPLTPGSRLALGGYGKDRAERLAVDPDCGFRGYAAEADGMPVVVHGCAGTSGSSGGAVLFRDAEGWRLAGVQVAAEAGAAGGVAVPGFTIAPLLKRLAR